MERSIVINLHLPHYSPEGNWWFTSSGDVHELLLKNIF